MVTLYSDELPPIEFGLRRLISEFNKNPVEWVAVTPSAEIVVKFDNGNTAKVQFASYIVAIEWVLSRRSLKNVAIRTLATEWYPRHRKQLVRKVKWVLTIWKKFDGNVRYRPLRERMMMMREIYVPENVAQTDEERQIIKLICRKDGILYAGGPSRKENTEIANKAYYVWRTLVFQVSDVRQHHCLPVMAMLLFDDEKTSKSLDDLVDRIMLTIPKEEWYGILAWHCAMRP